MKKTIMVLLDGFGMREDIYGNAVKNAGINNFINIWNKYPHCLLKSSGLSVGLPKGQSGSSEFGHKTISAGRLISNRLTMSNEFFSQKIINNNSKYKKMINYLKENPNNNLHVSILLSDGGVSSNIKHLKEFIEVINKDKITNNIYIQAISDGRDSNKYSLIEYLKEIDPYLKNNIYLSSICGRYYALDDTRDINRTKYYVDLLFGSDGVRATNIPQIIKLCYEKKLSDEYLPPLKANTFCPLNDGDVWLSLNFSTFNQYQIFDYLEKKKFPNYYDKYQNIQKYTLFEINKDFSENYFIDLLPVKNTLGEYLSCLGLTQARISERIKKTSIGFYFDGEKYLDLDNCDIFIVDSPKVERFDLKPEMNCLSVAKTAVECMEKDYDMIIVNFANPDEIGHTGNYPATINGLQAVDVCLGEIVEKAEENFYKVIIIGTHGNADTIIDRDNNIVTKNTLAPVPFIIMDKKVSLKNGDLTMVAPTILKYMDIALPKEMKKTEDLLK